MVHYTFNSAIIIFSVANPRTYFTPRFEGFVADSRCYTTVHNEIYKVNLNWEYMLPIVHSYRNLCKTIMYPLYLQTIYCVWLNGIQRIKYNYHVYTVCPVIYQQVGMQRIFLKDIEKMKNNEWKQIAIHVYIYFFPEIQDNINCIKETFSESSNCTSNPTYAPLFQRFRNISAIDFNKVNEMCG